MKKDGLQRMRVSPCDTTFVNDSSMVDSKEESKLRLEVNALEFTALWALTNDVMNSL